ncbi:MAG: arsenate reductase family protein [Bulleidia sp.]|nr:arsenate reductase family protein [Bulleidia sp.]
MNTFICYAKCSTCAKARKWLDNNGIAYNERPIKEQNPTAEELHTWIKKNGLDVRKFFNTSGQLYRSLNLKEKLKTMSEKEMIDLLATDGMLVKRPILVSDKAVLVGFKEAEWAETLR